MSDALVAFAPERWRNYCELARNVEMAFGRAMAAEEAGRSRLARKGAKFGGLIDYYEREALRVRRPDDVGSLVTEIAAIEDDLVVQLGEELNGGSHTVTGYCGDGHRRKIEPGDLSDATIDFAAIGQNVLVMPDGARISGIDITSRTGLRGSPTLAERPQRESLTKMQASYKRLRLEIAGLTCKAQYTRVLADLGIKDPPPGYGYETFRTKVAGQPERKKS